MKVLFILQEKQKQLLKKLNKSKNEVYKVKVLKHLSPIGWHILHCLYVECVWIRSYFFNDNELLNRLKEKADSNTINVIYRDSNIPEFKELFSLCEKEFKINITLVKNLIKRKTLKKQTLSYFINFLINHHCQHLETIEIILTLINLNKKKYFDDAFFEIEPKPYKYDPVNIKEDYYAIGADNRNFCFDNEKPKFKKLIPSFSIAKMLINISEWSYFLKSGGYHKKEFWSRTGWAWKTKNNISKPLNWIYKNNKLSICTSNGFKKPKGKEPVKHISYFELQAFANWQNLKIPHEFQWEISFDKLNNKFKAWEWSNNLFFPYENFIPYPYKEYSEPWFKNNYFTLKGASTLSEKEIKRKTFRNFYQPDKRFIFSGGRLGNY